MSKKTTIAAGVGGVVIGTAIGAASAFNLTSPAQQALDAYTYENMQGNINGIGIGGDGEIGIYAIGPNSGIESITTGEDGAVVIITSGQASVGIYGSDEEIPAYEGTAVPPLLLTPDL